VALGQIIAKMANLNPLDSPYKLGLLKDCLMGRYPQTISYQPGNPVSTLLKAPSALEGLGTGLKSMMINHLVALGNNRTLEAAALATIIEQGAAWEMGNSVGWYERYQLLGSAYQGYNANNLVLDLVKENAKGTVYDVVLSIMDRAISDGVIKQKGKEFPYVSPSGQIIYSVEDNPLWNAYICAALMAACIINSGASRAVQMASAVLAYFPDMMAFEGGGLPDPDSGRVMGTGVGYGFYTHGLYGGAGPGAFPADHVITKHTSGFMIPCAVAAMCLDAGTQIFKPSTTSGLYYILGKELPVFQNPMRKLAEAAEEIKDKI